MRVIAGKVRRMNLETPRGNDTRPTTDRIKETLFNILQPYLADCSFLDLFSGSGGIGIEALSRGANKAVFVDNARDAIRFIEGNLEHTRLTEQAEVLPMDALQALKNLEKRGQFFDVVFLDPPYDKGLEEPILRYLEGSSIIDTDTLIILETAKNYSLDYMMDIHYHIERIKEYKTNQHIFLTRKEDK